MIAQTDLKFLNDELLTLGKQFGNKVDAFLKNLKKSSSQEVLNGSIKKAQDMLNHLLLVEEKFKKLNNNVDEFLEALKHFKDFNSAAEERLISPQQPSFTSVKKNYEVKPDGSNQKIKLNILKGLIYLGGNGNRDDVGEFVYDELKRIDKNYLKEMNLVDNLDGLQQILVNESRKMLEEKLINIADEGQKWEILPKGIDFLAKNDN